MKISQIVTGRSVALQDVSPLQGLVLDEIRQRPDEVFQAADEELLRLIPNLKRSALSWSLWVLCQKGYLQKLRIRLNGRLTTVFGVPGAIEQLKIRLGRADAPERAPREPIRVRVRAPQDGFTPGQGELVRPGNGAEGPAEVASPEAGHHGISG